MPQNLPKSCSQRLFVLSVETEVWELENENSMTINPAVTGGHYINGIGMYAVEYDFCRKNK